MPTAIYLSTVRTGSMKCVRNTIICWGSLPWIMMKRGASFRPSIDYDGRIRNLTYFLKPTWHPTTWRPTSIFVLNEHRRRVVMFVGCSTIFSFLQVFRTRPQPNTASFDAHLTILQMMIYMRWRRVVGFVGFLRRFLFLLTKSSVLAGTIRSSDNLTHCRPTWLSATLNTHGLASGRRVRHVFGLFF